MVPELLQDFAYSYRVWITLIKLLYAPLQQPCQHPDIHQGERLCCRLLPAVPLVSEKNSSQPSPTEQPPPETLRPLGLQLLAQAASLLLCFFPLLDGSLGVALDLFGPRLLLGSPFPLTLEVL
jgi:hypothetical protein